MPREKENARFSIVAYNPVFEVTFKDGVLYENGKAIDQDPFEYLDQVTVKGIKSDLPFAGGAIGFAGYDMIGLYENIGEIPEDTIGTPDMHFFIYESYLIFDHKKEKVYVVEDNIYSGRDNDAVRQALGQVVTNLPNSGAKRVYTSGLASLYFQIISKKKSSWIWWLRLRNSFVREICSNACLANAFQRTLREIL
ncbi:MAG: hypothetical protein ACLUFP_02470 [Streptococcus salivarius]